eukprot:TRINITY_DN43529_c0_g1_i1.p1 TRINITY_DN43529_c0_g1~~TRINITY_DN43529_c0_g1_i1.p1  ORF type:complete len:337 (+),score=93.94 TRINITY_DN43529_c0_g1_i1:124-1134(+)
MFARSLTRGRELCIALDEEEEGDDGCRFDVQDAASTCTVDPPLPAAGESASCKSPRNKEELLETRTKAELNEAEAEATKTASEDIRIKAELRGERVAAEGVHRAKHPRAKPLVWAVLRPSDGLPPRKCPRRPRKTDEPDGSEAASAGERAVRRLRLLKTSGAAASLTRDAVAGQDDSGDSAKLADKATALLATSLGSAAEAESTAAALVAAMVAAHGARAARSRLLSLGAALRGNEEFRAGVLSAGPAGAVAVARQDPREWAGSELQAKRQQWAQESLKEAQVPKGQMAVCPECGGRAFVNTGRAGSGRAARLSKQYAHFTCTERHCGKVTHIQEG